MTCSDCESYDPEYKKKWKFRGWFKLPKRVDSLIGARCGLHGNPVERYNICDYYQSRFVND